MVHDESKREAFNSSVNKSAKREGRRFPFFLLFLKKKKKGEKNPTAYTTFPPDLAPTVTLPHFPPDSPKDQSRSALTLI